MSEHQETFSIPGFWVQASPQQVKEELDRGASLVLSSGTPALCLAALYSSDPGMLGVLLDNGADVNGSSTALTSEGETALHCAVAAANPVRAVVELLLNRGAAINARDRLGQTPLHSAMQSVYAQEPRILELLLARGAEVNAKSRNGWTPLHHAAMHKQEILIRQLMNAGADLAIRTINGETAYDIAVAYGAAKEIRDILRPE